jgi:hypothetical protein
VIRLNLCVVISPCSRLRMAIIVRKNPHQQTLESIEQELQECLQQQESMARRIAELQAAISALTPLAQEELYVPVPIRLPQLCLWVLSFSPTTHISVPRIRKGLMLRGIDLSGYKNPLAILHTTLGRLRDNGYVLVADGDTEGRGYRILPAGMLQMQREQRGRKDRIRSSGRGLEKTEASVSHNSPIIENAQTRNLHYSKPSPLTEL